MILSSRLLKNRVALVTGSNRGIGEKIIEIFAQNGADIWAHAREKNDEFEEKLKHLSSAHQVEIKPIYFDLLNEEEIKNSLQYLIQQKATIDILVNNAGIAHGSFFQMTSVNKIKDVFQINFFAQLSITQIMVRIIKKQSSGSIINISSIAGIDAEPGSIAYGSSKAALIYATRVLSKELAIDNIRVNTVAPGLTDTAMASQMENKAKNKMIENSAMGRLAQPDEIAKAVLYLASDLSLFVNGQIIRVDGGM